MSIKCSLLGHRFDETTVEREREEEGTEVVITITEVETCARCGESRVVSENKEVTSLEAPPEGPDTEASAGTDARETAEPTGAAEPEPEPDRGADAGGTATGAEAPAEGADDAEILGADDAGEDDETRAQAEARGGAETTIPDAESETTATTTGDDDAVILDDGPDEVDDGPTETAAESPASTEGATGATAEATAADGESGEPASGEAVPSESAAGSAEWPDEDVGSGPTAQPTEDDWPAETKRDPGADEAGASAPDLEPTEGATIAVPEGMFKCDECGFTTEVESSSLRAGDFCPECHQGTLVQDESESE